LKWIATREDQMTTLKIRMTPGTAPALLKSLLQSDLAFLTQMVVATAAAVGAQKNRLINLCPRQMTEATAM
jgi:hypothetical protein